VLEIDSLSAFYGKAQVLHDVTMEIGDNEHVAVMGRNGAGKTTTIRSIMGVGPRVEGDIRLDGDSIVGEPPESIFNRGITWVPEGRRLFTNLDVEDNLILGCRRKDAPDDRMAEVYDIFPRLEERKTQISGTLSGGEQQMLALGRALMSDPDFLLVDEPFEGLMPILVTELKDVFESLTDQEFSILIADHRAHETLELVERVVVLDKGAVVHAGDAETMLHDDELRRRYLGVQTT
jgi:branched-chain amino acid transport system ATP-binding protein